MFRDDKNRYHCVGCGYCCIRQTCTFGLQRHPRGGDKICPDLEWNGRRYVCRAMNLPGPMTSFYREQLQAGLGCRSYFNPWRKDVRPRTAEELKAIGDEVDPQIPPSPA